MCRELTPCLARAEHARIINVSGKLDVSDETDLDDLSFERGYSGIGAAMKTVHAKTVITQTLAEELASPGIDGIYAATSTELDGGAGGARTGLVIRLRPSVPR